ncbi:MAG: ABC transporter permease subunit [Clostridia bacterium]|jgi:peptide/nickel transport system permease protein|nr:ABC transporter permease subunit [Clostridia bacterium]
MRTKKEEISAEEKLYVASQWQLMWRKFVKHKLAIFGGGILAIFYLVAIFCEFFSVYDPYKRYTKYIYCPPSRIHFFDEKGFHFRPFVYSIKRKINLETFRKTYTEDKVKKYPIYFFIHSDKYKLWNLFKMDVHLFGVREGGMFLFGTDILGRDLFSRNLYAARISLSIGLIGVALSFVLGIILGGISGYYGGGADMIIQRIIEFLISIPTIPLWMALAAALPADWSPIKAYFGITIILSVVGWCGLARVVRGKFLELREEDFAMAAKIAGATQKRVIAKHLLPSFLSYLIVSLTLSIPGMILGETSLSFLGLGLRPPVISWGVLLKESQKVQTVALHPWLLIPGFFVIITVLAFSFLGDGLRDAADPYK